MLLRDPYSLNAICQSILHCLLGLNEQSKLPRVSQPACLWPCVRQLLLCFLHHRRVESLRVYCDCSSWG